MSDFRAQMDRATADVLKALEKAKVDVVCEAYKIIVEERSPIRTAAYRAENAIALADGSMLFGAWDRPGPSRRVADTGVEQFGIPSVSEAREAVNGSGLYDIVIFNDRFYCGWVEEGISPQAPLGVYQLTADEVSLFPLEDTVRIA